MCGKIGLLPFQRIFHFSSKVVSFWSVIRYAWWIINTSELCSACLHQIVFTGSSGSAVEQQQYHFLSFDDRKLKKKVPSKRNWYLNPIYLISLNQSTFDNMSEISNVLGKKLQSFCFKSFYFQDLRGLTSIHHTLAIFINFKTFRAEKNDPEKIQQQWRLVYLLWHSWETKSRYDWTDWLKSH